MRATRPLPGRRCTTSAMSRWPSRCRIRMCEQRIATSWRMPLVRCDCTHELEHSSMTTNHVAAMKQESGSRCQQMRWRASDATRRMQNERLPRSTRMQPRSWLKVAGCRSMEVVTSQELSWWIHGRYAWCGKSTKVGPTGRHGRGRRGSVG